MDNHVRARHYVRAHYPAVTSDEMADRELRFAYRDGSADDLLTPAQRRRRKHKRGTSSYARRRGAVSASETDYSPLREPTEAEKGKLLRVIKGGLAAAGWNVR
jgi:hypothetical protein